MIQPECLVLVIIGEDWDVKADLWNLGCLISKFVRGTELFDPDRNNEESRMNSTQTHLAQMTGSLLKGAGRYSISLEALLCGAGHSPQDVYEVGSVFSHILIINPKERWSAAKLLDHPWLRDADGLIVMIRPS